MIILKLIISCLINLGNGNNSKLIKFKCTSIPNPKKSSNAIYFNSTIN
jgi:hypothetical protein